MMAKKQKLLPQEKQTLIKKYMDEYVYIVDDNYSILKVVSGTQLYENFCTFCRNEKYTYSTPYNRFMEYVEGNYPVIRSGNKRTTYFKNLLPITVKLLRGAGPPLIKEK